MRKLIVWFVILGLVAMVGCTRKVRSHETNIKEIKNEPEKFRGQQCIVEGYVTSVLDLPILKYDAFKVHDGTGEIWIYTVEGVPPEKIQVRVKGILKKFVEIPFGIKTEIGYYIELNEMKFL